MVLKKIKSTKSKNVSALPAKEDFSVLDSAVSELAKQTEALLGKTGEKLSKPVLPKKRPKQNSKAKSFDIIHNPDPSKRSEALLKAPHPGQKLLEADDTGSIATVDSKKTGTKKASEVDSTVGVSTHTPGALKFTAEKTIEPLVDDNGANKPGVKSSNAEPVIKEDLKDSEVKDEPITKLDDVEADSSNKTSDSSAVTNSIEYDESNPVTKQDKEDEVKVVELSADTVESSADDSKMDGVVSLAEQGESDSSEKSDSSQKVQLFSDNLDKSKSESNDEDGPQPEIFDTDEYHPTLHDWSKLEHHSSVPKVTLLVLLVILAAGVYIVVSGVKLPFLP